MQRELWDMSDCPNCAAMRRTMKMHAGDIWSLNGEFETEHEMRVQAEDTADRLRAAIDACADDMTRQRIYERAAIGDRCRVCLEAMYLPGEGFPRICNGCLPYMPLAVGEAEAPEHHRETSTD